MLSHTCFVIPPAQDGSIIRDNLYGCVAKCKTKYLWPPMALAQLAAINIDECNFSEILDFIVNKSNLDNAVKTIREGKYDFMVIITNHSTFYNDLEFSEEVKKNCKEIKIIFCGDYVTQNKEQALSNPEIDYIIIGEPDYTISKLISNLMNDKDISTIKGLGYRINKKNIFNGQSENIKSLDDLPFPARDLLNQEKYFNPFAKQLPFTTIMSSRGCPYNCSFCVTGQVYGKKFRARSVKSMIAEIVYCNEELGIKEFFFRDEIFTFDRERIKQFCMELINLDLNISWMCATRVDKLDYALLEWMKLSGCHLIKFGVESGSQLILDDVNKGFTVEDTIKTFEYLKDLKIDSVAHLIIGTSKETIATLNETIKFLEKIEPSYVSVNIAFPYPGTEFEKQEPCKLSKSLLLHYSNKIHRNFHSRPTYIWRRIKSINSFGEFKRLFLSGLRFLWGSFKNKSNEE